MKAEKAGTIRTKEAKQVVGDLLVSRNVSKAVYKMKPGGELNMLVGSRQVTFQCKAGMSFYGLQALLASVNRAIDEMSIARDARQIDIEDAIRQAAA